MTDRFALLRRWSFQRYEGEGEAYLTRNAGLTISLKRREAETDFDSG